MKLTGTQVILGFCVLALSGSMLIGQADEDGQRQRPRALQERRGNFDPEQRQHMREEFRRRYAEWLREHLGVSDDEEWKTVLQPRLEKVVALQRSGRGGRSGFWRRGRGGEGGRDRGAGADGESSVLQQKSTGLRELLDNESATTDQINAALTALRQARQENEDALAKARKDLRDVVTLKQEAYLVLMGILP